MTPGPLAGRVAVVTGGTGALGRAVTLRLLADGAAVSVPYVVDAERDALLARVPVEPGRLLVRRSDVTDEAAMAAFVDAVHAHHGRIDILVTAVGGFAPGDLLATDRRTWDGMLGLNLTSAFVAARAIVPDMVAAGYGRIVTVASRAVLPPAGGFIAYTVAKAGLIAFTQALAAELKGHGVSVNAVLPSTMDTPANRAAMPDSDRQGWVPVESVAEAIAFLVHDRAGDVTGALVTV
ncbi:MAG: SDR family oxidoreductase [Candidatus Rokubacteria bacterium]|nr:SDR family oxidoreductase [Candidatus Rokubacteria bacterium]